MGSVYQAWDPRLRRAVVVKRLNPLYSQYPQLGDWFEREAHLASQIQHPNAITIHDYGFDQGAPYLVMEYLEGPTLADIMHGDQDPGKHPFTPARIYELVSPIANALAKAHSLGIVHRDLKPENVMVIRDAAYGELVKVLDFGIAKLLRDETLSPAGAIVGTPYYMAPEQAGTQAVDARADLYALGVILYEMLAGRRPFEGDVHVVLNQKTNLDSPSLDQAGRKPPVPAALAQVVDRAIRRDPRDRYESAVDMMSALKGAIFPAAAAIRGALGVGGSAARTGPPEPVYSVDELVEILDRAQREHDTGGFLAAFEAIAPALDNGVRDPRLIYLAILSLARCGASRPALEHYRRFRRFLTATEDHSALGARLRKDRFLAAKSGDEREQLGSKAFNAYRLIFARTGGFFPAINAATIAFLKGDGALARNCAEQALSALHSGREDDYWVYATRAEADLILGRSNEVGHSLETALRCPNATVANRVSTLRQLLLLSEKRGEELAALEILRPPACAHYTGHMIDGIGSTPGIDPADEASLRERARELIRAERIGTAFGSLACGADLIVAEELFEAGAELGIVLPFGVETFRRVSVAPAGEVWCAAFDRVLSKVRASNLTIVDEDPCEDQELLFHLASRQAMGMARLRARALQSRSLQIALWNGHDGDGRVGTAADVSAWRALGGTLRHVQVAAPRAGVSVDRKIDAAGTAASRRELVAVIFADVQGFSRIRDRKLLAFFAEWYARLEEILNGRRELLAHANTWGDGLYLVMRDLTQAVAIADSLSRISLDGPHRVRVSLHAGPAFPVYDPIVEKMGFSGSSVSLAARMEACTPEGSVFATESFAALLETAGAPGFRLTYSGLTTLPKGMGQQRMYYIERV